MICTLDLIRSTGWHIALSKASHWLKKQTWPKRNFWFEVNGRFWTTSCVTLYNWAKFFRFPRSLIWPHPILSPDRPGVMLVIWPLFLVESPPPPRKTHLTFWGSAFRTSRRRTSCAVGFGWSGMWRVWDNADLMTQICVFKFYHQSLSYLYKSKMCKLYKFSLIFIQITFI